MYTCDPRQKHANANASSDKDNQSPLAPGANASLAYALLSLQQNKL